jgi:hypothetical protein
MNNLELLSIIDNCSILKNNCLGVFALDTFPESIKPGDCFIFNSDPQDQVGRHWLAVNRSSSGILEYFDSYGQSPIVPFQYPKVVYNTKQVQDLFSNVCGQHTLFYLYLRLRGVCFKNIITKCYTSSPCFNDELVLKFVGQVSKTNLPSVLNEPVMICKSFYDVDPGSFIS